MSKMKRYLGDSMGGGVYVDYQDGCLVLSTEGHENVVVLEPEVYWALREYVKNLPRLLEERAREKDKRVSQRMRR